MKINYLLINSAQNSGNSAGMWQVLIMGTILGWTLIAFQTAGYALAATKSSNPTVAVVTFDTSGAGDVNYMGPALRSMLISRLASEKLDIEDEPDAQFVIRGMVKKDSKGKIQIEIKLFEEDSDSIISSWLINPPSANSIIPETSRYCILIAEKIKGIENSRAIQKALSQTTDAFGNTEQSLMQNRQLKIARIHPDLLYRETPADQKGSKPIDAVPEPEKEEAGPISGKPQTTVEKAEDEPPEYEDDNLIPDYPPDYAEDEDFTDEQQAASAARAKPVIKTEEVKAAAKDDDEWSVWPFENHDEKKSMPAPVPATKLPYPVPPAIKQAGESTAWDMPAENRRAAYPESSQAAQPVGYAVLETQKTQHQEDAAYPPVANLDKSDIEQLNRLSHDGNNYQQDQQTPPDTPEESGINDTASTEREQANRRTGERAPISGTREPHEVKLQAVPDLEEGTPLPRPDRNIPTSPNETAENNYNPAAITASPSPDEPYPSVPSEAGAYMDTDQPFAAGLSAISTPSGDVTSTHPAESASAMNRVRHSQEASTLDKGTPGWFSWLWPDAWKGGGKNAPPSTTDNVRPRPANNQDNNAQGSRPHDASGTSSQGPVWVWN